MNCHNNSDHDRHDDYDNHNNYNKATRNRRGISVRQNLFVRNRPKFFDEIIGNMIVFPCYRESNQHNNLKNVIIVFFHGIFVCAYEDRVRHSILMVNAYSVNDGRIL